MKRLTLFVLLLWSGLAGANTQLYDDETLEYWQGRYRENVQWNFDNLIVGNLTPQERRRLGRVDLQMPLRAPGRLAGDPLVFYAGSGRIVAPVKSIKFFDDISIALAYYQLRGGDIQTVYDYLAMLKYRDPADLPGGRFPPPLQALGVPAEIWKEDKEVDSLSQKILKSGLVWILAHETAHLLYAHPGYGPDVGAQQAQANEAQADRFANRIMRSIGVAPGGMAAYFMMMAHWSAGLADFPDREAWLKYQTAEATHPFTGSRMRALAEDLRRSPADFTAGEDDPAAARARVEYIAAQIDLIAQMLEDGDVSKGIMLKGRATDLQALQAGWINKPEGGTRATRLDFDGEYSGSFEQRLRGGGMEELPVHMELQRQGKRVNGVYRFGLGDASLQGFVRDGRLYFEWQYVDSSGMGMLQPQDGGLVGTWGYLNSLDNAGTLQLGRP